MEEKFGKNYREIIKLAKTLALNKVEFDLVTAYDGYQILVRCNDDTVISFIEHMGSYGHEKDLIEACIMPAWMSSHEPEGYLTAEQAFKYFKYKGSKYYDEFDD